MIREGPSAWDVDAAVLDEEKKVLEAGVEEIKAEIAQRESVTGITNSDEEENPDNVPEE